MHSHNSPLFFPTTKSDALLKKSFQDFLKKPEAYRMQYLQARFRIAFDGYSYIGQTDSLNQYDTDLLHSFVLSDFQDKSKFPVEFHEFLNTEWADLISAISSIERARIRQLNITGLEDFYDQFIGHMISLNYYPSMNKTLAENQSELRLSNHKDVSLFTTFPFGLKKGLVYDGVELGERKETIVFQGYFLELFTGGALSALDHQVEIPEERHAERFSFAFFSLPMPGCAFEVNGQAMSSEAYYQQYLSLF